MRAVRTGFGSGSVVHTFEEKDRRYQLFGIREKVLENERFRPQKKRVDNVIS
jgi:hypothetical protein